MSINTPFTVLHKNPEAREVLGVGTVIGDVLKTRKEQVKELVARGGRNVEAIVTEEKITVYYQVLWENARDTSPSLHKSTDLMWSEILLSADVDDEDYEDDEDDTEEETEETEGDFTETTDDTLDFASEELDNDDTLTEGTTAWENADTESTSNLNTTV